MPSLVTDRDSICSAGGTRARSPPEGSADPPRALLCTGRRVRRWSGASREAPTCALSPSPHPPGPRFRSTTAPGASPQPPQRGCPSHAGFGCSGPSAVAESGRGFLPLAEPVAPGAAQPDTRTHHPPRAVPSPQLRPAPVEVVPHRWSRRWSCLRKALWQMSQV